MSRIYYQGKYYDYPIKPMNALRNLGPVEAVRCVLSYLAVKVRTAKSQETSRTTSWPTTAAALFDHFFKTYNEKVWGVPASAISADWGAQRIKGMSIVDAIWEPIRAKLAGRRQDRSKQVTSLIEEFQYPKYGPARCGRCAPTRCVRGHRGPHGDRVDRVEHADGRATKVFATAKDGTKLTFDADHVVSSMPFPSCCGRWTPAPAEVLAAADDLGFRDF